MKKEKEKRNKHIKKKGKIKKVKKEKIQTEGLRRRRRKKSIFSLLKKKEVTEESRNFIRRKKLKEKRSFIIIFSLLVLFFLFIFVSIYSRSLVSSAKEAVLETTGLKNQSSKKSDSKTVSSSSKKKEVLLPEEGPQIALASNFPDPAIIYVDETYYMYGTNLGPLQQLPMATSTGLTGFQEVGQALAYRPIYGNNASTTSPYVAYIDDQYVMYLGASVGSNLQRLYVIATATSETPEGPFIPTDNALLGAPVGSNDNFFDPDFFMDKKEGNYLLYSTDGTLGTNIWMHELSEDGLSITEEGESILVMESTDVETPEGEIVPRVESPTLVKAEDGTYVLFFAAGDAERDDCFIGYATSKDIEGPYENQGPLITTDTFENQSFKGPGEVSSFIANDKNYLIFNGWVGEHNSFEVIWGGRYAYIMELTWKDGHTPYFNKTMTQIQETGA
ncbi:MAG: family 43 glycosylhydrolase [Lactovum sp.]